MTNSEIIRVIISKNPTKRTSSLRKCQILQLAARYGTADDIRAAFQAYGQFEFVSGAFMYVFAYADLEKLDAMLENEATLHTDDDQWSYILYVLQNYDPLSREEDQLLAERFAGEEFLPLPKKTITDVQRADMIQRFCSFEKSRYGNPEEYALFNDVEYAKLILFSIVLGNCGFAKELLRRGFKITERAIDFVNSADYCLFRKLSKLDPKQSEESLFMLCDVAESIGMTIMPDKFFLEFASDKVSLKFLTCFLDRCDLNRFSKKEIVDKIISFDDPSLLQVLDDRGFFDNTTARKNAILFAKDNGYTVSLRWLETATPAIKSRSEKKKQGLEKRTINDAENAKWFTHKGNVITGLSKKGINAIREKQICEIELPSMIDGAIVDTLGKYALEDFTSLVPHLHTLIIPRDFIIEGKIGEIPRGAAEPEGDVGIQNVVFTSESSFSIGRIGQRIASIKIIEGKKYKTIDGEVFNGDGTQLLFYPRGSHRSEYVIPSSVRSIAREAFLRCTIDTLIIPDSVSELGKRVAWDSKIQKIDISGNIKKIPDGAFSGCSSLVELVLHEGLEVIGEAAFSYCGATSVVFPASLREISKDAFRCSTSKFSFSSDDVIIGPHSFYDCNRIDTHYSKIIEGKMQRCGYSPYDYCDLWCGMTRDQAIEKLWQLSGEKTDIPESMYMHEIMDLIRSYESQKTTP